MGFRWTFSVLTALLAGCSSNVYEVELRPKGDAIERELTCWEEGGSRSADDKGESAVSALSQEELQRIAKAYGEPVPKSEARKFHFADTFKGALPGDIGGAGSYTRWQSPLGELLVYVERVRGNDDLFADLDERRATLNRLVDVLVAWLDAELKGDPIAPQLHAFVDGPLRRDAANVLLVAWTAESASSDTSENDDTSTIRLCEAILRCAQYLAERKYMRPNDVPAFERAIRDADQHETFVRLADLLSDAVARKLSLPSREPLAALTKLLADPKRVERTLLPHVVKTPEFERRAAEKRARPNEGDEQQDRARDVIGEMLLAIYVPQMFLGAPDRLRLALHADVRPVVTNGQFDAKEKRISWNRSIPKAAATRGMPTILFAVWAKPDEAAQRQRFGKVALSDAALSKYVLWYRGLDERERATWDQLISRLEPGDSLASGVKALRFPGDNARGDNDLAAQPRELIIKAVE